MSAVERMPAEDLKIIKQCLDAAVNGPFFPEWEFRTLMGFSRDEITAIAAAWPAFAEPDEQAYAVNNVLNMLLGYPHGHDTRWHEYSQATPEQLARVLARWRGEDDIDGTAKGTFDRMR